ncbi:restriction endonuclease subunit S [Romboutsia ilealis]|uniref:restriction endonuclease subunit S n=1 Tax=Romboutsia ilealis TaxID=1115758 RepID=UPI0024951A77|nr:restriction endonuclease subunit S [Romboutsia ilealis]
MSCNEWKELTLEDIGDIVGGGTPSTKNENYYGDEISWITPKDLSGYTSKYISKGERSITKLGLEKSSAKLLPKGTVLFSSRAPIGYVAIAENELTTNQGFKSIICNPKIANNEFIYYRMKLAKYELESIAGGSTFKEVSGKVMKEFKISLPPLGEQEKIANILSSLDDKIELNNEMNKTLEEMAQSIFKRWFVDFEFPNEDGEPYKSSGGEMVDSELGMIPKGWEVGTLDNLGVFKNGKGINQDLRNDNGKNLIYGSNGIIGKTDEVLQKDNCIIIGRVGAYCGSIQLSLEPCWVTDNAIMGTAKQRKYLPYLHRFLLNYPLRESAGGSAQPLINQSILKSILTVMPPNELFDKYYDISKEIIYKIDDNNKENIMLSEIRDSLLPKLMSGEISVN